MRSARAGWVAVALVATAGVVRAQDRDARAIAAASGAIVAEMSPSLPRMSVAAWLRASAGPTASITWEVNDCGEQTGNPEVDRGRNMPLCAEARIALSPERNLFLSFLVGTFARGIAGQPALYSAVLVERKGWSIHAQSLALVPTLMSEPARLRQAEQWVASIRPRMTRNDVEGLLGRPVVDGGIIEIGHTRYYLGWDVKIEVPYDTANSGPRSQTPTDRVSGAAAISRGPVAID